jgi:prepilin-type N-terminal cleavage/methylation domain-containing protein
MTGFSPQSAPASPVALRSVSNGARPPMDRPERGFTLIELLVVMAIIATLVGLGVVAMPYIMGRGDKVAAETFLSTLTAGLEAYRGSEGAYPPTSLAEYAGVGVNNTENTGIESVVLCLNSNRYSGSFDFSGTKGCKLENFDTDATQAQLTKFGTKELFEAVDPWGIPYVYFNAMDYTRAEDLGKVSGENGVIKCLPYKDPKTKSFYRRDTFQLISAGKDKTFNTEDDVTNFNRE